MNLRRVTRVGTLALGLVLLTPLHAKDSGDCDVPINLGNEPEMSEYSQLNAFIAAALEYKQAQRERDDHRKSCPELYLRPPTQWIDDPTVTQGPETLDSAVERSDSFPGLDYSSTSEWYGRSTSESFGLDDLASNQMADSLIQTSLATDASGDGAGAGAGTDQGLTTAGLTESQQQAILILLASGQATENGAFGQDTTLDQLTRNLLLTEQAVSEILASSIGDLATLVVSPGGIGVFSGSEGQNIRVSSRYEMDTCLSSCGEFQITIGWQ